MTKTINVTFDHENIALNIQEPDEEILAGEVVEWIFHGVPGNFSPNILFNAMVEEDSEDDENRYYGPFLAVTQEIPGIDGGCTRFWGVVTHPALRTYQYRAAIQTGVGEDPFDEPYGNSPDSVGKAVVVSKEAVLRRERLKPSKDALGEYAEKIQQITQGLDPLTVLSGASKIIPITQNDQGGRSELCIHDHDLFVRRVEHDTVVWDFTAVPFSRGWFPIVDFIGGEGMAYDDIINMHFGPFSAITYTPNKVVGTGHGKVPGEYHYRVAMANISTHRMAFKSSPDPVVDYPEPPSSGGGSGGGTGN